MKIFSHTKNFSAELFCLADLFSLFQSLAMNSSKSLLEYYELFYEYADPRIRDYPLMGYPHWVVISFGFYLILATFILPRYMKHRKPIDLSQYTIYLDGILLSTAFFYFMLGCYGWFFLYDWFCQPIDSSDSWTAIMTVRISYSFLLTKYIYVMHHLPYVLSKRKSPLINYLLVHHVTFPIMVWTIINFYPGGHVTFAGFINAATHVMLFGMKFVVIIFPSVKSWRRQFHFGVHVS